MNDEKPEDLLKLVLKKIKRKENAEFRALIMERLYYRLQAGWYRFGDILCGGNFRLMAFLMFALWGFVCTLAMLIGHLSFH